ncbi:MAG: hypothetical protein B6D64_14005 [Bacteroidetes bacterium 4484_276]|nr:MAG: hypothetical protein B6D64_14005 [Bacteroidetes bacterium 4484_276]
MKHLIVGKKRKINRAFILVGVVTLLFSITAYSQKEYIQPGQNFKSGKIYLKSNQFIKVWNVQLLNDSTLKYLTVGGSEKYLSTSEVHWLSIKKGSKAGTGALLGGSVGILSVLLAQMQHESDPYAEKIEWGPLYLGFGIGGLLLGTLIGSASSRTKSLYMPSYILSDKLRCGPSVKHSYPSLLLEYKL